MKCFFWNIRGVANTPSRLALKRVIQTLKPDIILLVEPWMQYDKFPASWLDRLDMKLFVFNNRNQLNPNLWCICKKDINPLVLNCDSQHVAFTINYLNHTFGIAAVYASTCHVNRRQLWCSLASLMVGDTPWCFIGDFNVILGCHEHKGNFFPAKGLMAEFQIWTDSYNMLRIPTNGPWFTWNNGRQGKAHTEKRLDRAVCNQKWLEVCSKLALTSLIRNRSDHHPLLMDFDMNEAMHRANFKFLKMWSLNSSCKEVVANSWKEEVIGCPMFILSTKLKRLKEKLKIWNKEIFGNVHEQVVVAEKRLQEIQEEIHDTGFNDQLRNLERKSQINLDEALLRQNWFWQEKAKVRDFLLTDNKEITEYITNYFKNLFTSNSGIVQDQEFVDDVIPNLVDEGSNVILTMLPSSLEIKNAVFALNKDGARGPDGYGAFFYQTFWDIIHKDVELATLEFFKTGWLLPNFNANILALLPKVNGANSLGKFRPIAMANFKFKVITKILADRLAAMMPELISSEQRGFIHGRQIKDCICMASEAANSLHIRTFGGNIALKINVANGFDTLEWPFLLKVLKAYGFCQKFCHWIEAILGSATLSISVNGSLHGYFKCSRGVRQGDPLSPLLFCLAEDVLSRHISKLVEEKKLKLIQASRGVTISSHCLYADDIMIYCTGKKSNLQWLRNLFSRYANCPGQSVIDYCPNILSIVNKVVLPTENREDCLVWKLSDTGDMSLKQAYDFKCKTNIQLHWPRNLLRFQNMSTSWRNEITYIKAHVTLAGTWTTHTFRNSLENFRILKLFDIPVHPPRPLVTKEIFWVPPLENWVKANTDGAANNVTSACGGIFRNSTGDFIVDFSENLGPHNTFYAEIFGAMRAIEVAQQHQWQHLWLETDSSLVVKAFKNQASIPWYLRNRWHNCQAYTRQILFLVTHVYREANPCANLLANEGLSVDDYQSFISIPQSILSSVISNKLGRPNFRISFV
ncbi:uncharacterized protein LOC131659617 [Vicia villosa]|uniref:uncharacterized protein LOC131659617 n=1 Tax=Vicia villosa TaxID=3911 RepID=UPI00273C1A84|nr:uncharacterized protein LOC131659617 [Vicia villosa]